MPAISKLTPRSAARLLGEDDILSSLAKDSDLEGVIATLSSLSTLIGGVAIQCASIGGDLAPFSLADPEAPVGQAVEDDQFIALTSAFDDGPFSRVSRRINEILMQHSRAERPDVPDADRIITIKVSALGSEILHERFPAEFGGNQAEAIWLDEAQVDRLVERLMADFPVAPPPSRALPN